MKTKSSKNHREKKLEYKKTKNPLDFYISEKTAIYDTVKPFSVFYNNQEHSIRLLIGDCIKTLNQAKENSVDMIFANPLIFFPMVVSPVKVDGWFLLIKVNGTNQKVQ